MRGYRPGRLTRRAPTCTVGAHAEAGRALRRCWNSPSSFWGNAASPSSAHCTAGETEASRSWKTEVLTCPILSELRFVMSLGTQGLQGGRARSTGPWEDTQLAPLWLHLRTCLSFSLSVPTSPAAPPHRAPAPRKPRPPRPGQHRRCAAPPMGGQAQARAPLCFAHCFFFFFFSFPFSFLLTHTSPHPSSSVSFFQLFILSCHQYLCAGN